MKVGNILIFRDEKFGHHRYFEVVGVFLGGENEESLIQLRSLSEKPGFDGLAHRETNLVPECLTRQLEVRENLTELVGA